MHFSMKNMLALCPVRTLLTFFSTKGDTKKIMVFSSEASDI